MNNVGNTCIILSPGDLTELMTEIVRNELKQLEERLTKPSRILTREQAAEILGVSPNTLSNYVRQGLIPNRGIGRRILILETDLNKAPGHKRFYNENC